MRGQKEWSWVWSTQPCSEHKINSCRNDKGKYEKRCQKCWSNHPNLKTVCRDVWSQHDVVVRYTPNAPKTYGSFFQCEQYKGIIYILWQRKAKQNHNFCHLWIVIIFTKYWRLVRIRGIFYCSSAISLALYNPWDSSR